MKTITKFFVGAALLMSGCQSKPTDHQHDHHATEAVEQGPVAKLEKQVLDTHDSIMTQMGELMRLKKAVSVELEKVADKKEKEQGVAIRNELDGAYNGMMDWMQAYNGDTLKKIDEAKALAYLKEQQLKVTGVRDKMRKSMAEAEHYLD